MELEGPLVHFINFRAVIDLVTNDLGNVLLDAVVHALHVRPAIFCRAARRRARGAHEGVTNLV